MKKLHSALFGLAILLATGCGNSNDDHGHSHETSDHAPPHGGTPVLVAEDEFHLELVLDTDATTMQAYVLDGHLEGYVQVAETGFEMIATSDGNSEELKFTRAADPGTGAVSQKSALFEAQADWLKSANEFEGKISTITLDGKTFTNISFPFPKGTKHVH